MAWHKLILALDENPITLYKVDLVHYEQMSDDYKKNIDTDGVRLDD